MILLPIPPLGIIVWEYGAVESCVDVTGNVYEDIWEYRLDCLIGLFNGTCTRWVLQPYTTAHILLHSYWLHTRWPSRPRTSRARVLLLRRRLLSSGHVRARVVTPSLNT